MVKKDMDEYDFHAYMTLVKELRRDGMTTHDAMIKATQLLYFE